MKKYFLLVTLIICVSGLVGAADAGLTNQQLEALVTEKTLPELEKFLQGEGVLLLNQVGSRLYIPLYAARTAPVKLNVLKNCKSVSGSAAWGVALCLAVSDYLWDSSYGLQAIKNLLAAGAPANPKWWRAGPETGLSLMDFVQNSPNDESVKKAILELLQVAVDAEQAR